MRKQDGGNNPKTWRQGDILLKSKACSSTADKKRKEKKALYLVPISNQLP